VFPGGVNSNVRLTAPRRFFRRAAGSHLWDEDGNDYIDYLLGQGPAFLGHAHPVVNRAVATASDLGMVTGAQCVEEVEAGDALLQALRWPEQVRFAVSGSEAVQATLRLARAATGRPKILRFERHYHGWLDNIAVERATGSQHRAAGVTPGQVAGAYEDVFVIPWNDVDACRELFEEEGSNIAGVITEPIMFNNGAVLPKDGFLQFLREITVAHGSVLIFDEVISGFRVALGGAAELFGVTPDLATYGKAMAGGWPVAAFAGRRDLMELCADGVLHAGTFNGSRMAAAAVASTLHVLTRDPPYERVQDYGEALMKGLRSVADAHSLGLRLQGVPAAFHASVTTGSSSQETGGTPVSAPSLYPRLARILADEGVWVAARGIWYVSTAHTARDLEESLDRVDKAVATFARELP
jgi:glutamate-1-semialdehyde 2,1-aminomutase